MVCLLCLAGTVAAQDGVSAPRATVSSVTVTPQEAGGCLITIEASDDVYYETFRLAGTLEAPPRLVVAIRDANLLPGILSETVHRGGVLRVRASQFSTLPAVVRVVL